MTRLKKDSVKVNYSLERHIVEQLDEFCERTGRTKTKVVEMAIADFIEKHKEEIDNK